MASATPRIRSTSIEAREFPELAGHYEVYSVPKIVVNEIHSFTGGLPEKQFVQSVLAALNGASEE